MVFPLYYLVLVVSASTSQSASVTIPNYAAAVRVIAVDTGTSTAGTPVLLTPDLIASYVKLDKTLTAYWDSHPAEKKSALEHGQSYNLSSTGNTSVGVSMPDYPTLIQHDTAVSVIFSQHHFAPDQYGPTHIAVQLAIVAVLKKAAIDSLTVVGKNMAAVRSHRPELATDWSIVQNNLSILDTFRDQWNQQMQNGATGGQPQDLNP